MKPELNPRLATDQLIKGLDQDFVVLPGHGGHQHTKPFMRKNVGV
jgi:hypothetical protein